MDGSIARRIEQNRARGVLVNEIDALLLRLEITQGGPRVGIINTLLEKLTAYFIRMKGEPVDNTTRQLVIRLIDQLEDEEDIKEELYHIMKFRMTDDTFVPISHDLDEQIHELLEFVPRSRKRKGGKGTKRKRMTGKRMTGKRMTGKRTTGKGTTGKKR